MTLVLDVTPTPAMLRGDQRVYQCSWCGCVVVSPSDSHRPAGPCPAEHQEPTTWWEQSFPVAGLSLRPPHQREDRPMTYLPTPEQFLAEPSTEEDDYEEDDYEEDDYEEVTVGPLESIAASLRSIAITMGQPVVEAVTAAASREVIDSLEHDLADLEDKHRSLYELLAEVEKIVAKSSSKVSLDVKAAINAWRNPVVEADPEGAGREPEQPVVPAADADVEQWREYARATGVLPDEPDAIDSMNRSQIRTLLGLPHFDPQA